MRTWMTIVSYDEKYKAFNCVDNDELGIEHRIILDFPIHINPENLIGKQVSILYAMPVLELGIDPKIEKSTE